MIQKRRQKGLLATIADLYTNKYCRRFYMMSKLLVVLAGLSIASLAHAYVPNIQQACAAVPLCDSVSVTKSPDHELWPHAWLVSCKKNVPGKTPKYDESLFSNTLLLTHHLFIWNV